MSELEGLVGGITEFPVCLALQSGQVEQLRRRHFFDLAGVFGYCAGFAGDLRADVLGLFLIEDLGVFCFGVDIGAIVIAEIGADFPVILRHERGYLVVACDEHGEGGGLYAADGEVCVVFEGEGA